MSKSKVPNLTYKEPAVRDTRIGLGFEVRGQTMIMNRFSDKSIEEMLAKHMGIGVERKKKVPRELIEQAIQRNETGAIAVPSTAMKKAILTAASSMKDFAKNKVILRIGVFIKGASIPIEFETMVPRMDITRNSGPTRTPDVRFRPQFNNWSARFVVLFDPKMIAETTIVNLVHLAGSVGLGEWRPERNGDHGTFEISKILEKSEIDETIKRCAPIIKPTIIPDWALDLSMDLTTIQQILHGEEPGEEPTETTEDESAA